MIGEDILSNMPKGNFHLNKWYLDFVGNNGESLIFYAANLSWHGLLVPYTSYLYYDPSEGVRQKSRFRNIRMPEIRKNQIVWSDSKFEVEGSWESLAKPIQTRLYDSKEGFLDWNCLQPASKVRLIINGKILEGSGYVEQLILTVPPWHIPMNELRWGHFGSSENQLVWIELGEENKRQHLWWNGTKIKTCTIEDDAIFIPEKNGILKLDRGVVLESKKKIFSLVKYLMDLIPGFEKVIPLNFLMAQEFKWLSKGHLLIDGKTIASGMAIHELVNFKSKSL